MRFIVLLTLWRVSSFSFTIALLSVFLLVRAARCHASQEAQLFDVRKKRLRGKESRTAQILLHAASKTHCVCDKLAPVQCLISFVSGDGALRIRLPRTTRTSFNPTHRK